jgi:glycerol kinase
MKEIRVDGGATANGFLMQFQADILGVPVVIQEVTETTAPMMIQNSS